MADPTSSSSSSAPLGQDALSQDGAPEGFSPEKLVVARVASYVAIGVLALLAGVFLIAFPPAGVMGLVAGLGVYYGAVGVLTFGPGIFEGGGASSVPRRRRNDVPGSRFSSNGSGPSSSSNPGESSSSSSSPNIRRRKLSQASGSSSSSNPSLSSSVSSSFSSSLPVDSVISQKLTLKDLKDALWWLEVDNLPADIQQDFLKIFNADRNIDQINEMIQKDWGFYGQYLKKASLEELKEALSSYKVDEMYLEMQDYLRVLFYRGGLEFLQNFVDQDPNLRQFRKGESSESSSSPAPAPIIPPLSSEVSPLEELEEPLQDYDVSQFDPLTQGHILGLLSREGPEAVKNHVRENPELFEPHFDRSRGKEEVKAPPTPQGPLIRVYDVPERSRSAPVSRGHSREPGSITFSEPSPRVASGSPKWLFKEIHTNDSYPPRANWQRRTIVSVSESV